MATDPYELYLVIAQVAAVFAGFGSLASGVGQRGGGDDARIDAYRLSLMLISSLSATVLGLVPATLASLSFETGAALRLAASAGVLALVINIPVSAMRVSRIRHVEGFNLAAGIANTLCAVIALAGFALCAFGIAEAPAPGLYLIGLMGLLGSSIVMFSRVIVSLLRPHAKGANDF